MDVEENQPVNEGNVEESDEKQVPCGVLNIFGAFFIFMHDNGWFDLDRTSLN